MKMSQALFLLSTILWFVSSVFSEIKISRIGNGSGAVKTPYLVDSYDLFSNKGGQGFCSKRLSYCKDSYCRECQCNYQLSFYSFEKGCVSYDDLRKTPQPMANSSSVGQGCEFTFYYFNKNTVPVWLQTAAFGTNSLRVANKDSIIPTSVNLDNPNVKCLATGIYKVDGNGNTLVDKNEDEKTFKIQNYIYQRDGKLHYIKNLVMNSLSKTIENNMAGHLIKLGVKCVDSVENFETSSCILFKTNGTYLECADGYFGFDCKGVCRCTSNQNCDRVTGTCTCKPGYIGDTCSIQNSVITNKSPTSSSNKKITTKKPQFSKTTATAPNATVAILDTRKGSSTPIGAIVGGIIGLIVVLLLIGILCYFFRRKRGRRSARPDSPTKQEMLEKDKSLNGNDTSFSPNGAIPSFSLNQLPHDSENIEMQDTINPYYAPSDKKNESNVLNSDAKESENLYYRPADLSIGPNKSEAGDVYYSSADVMDRPAKGKGEITGGKGVQEYSYARTDSPSPIKEPESHYKALDNTQYEPGMYQTLDNPVGKRPRTDPSNQEQINPYYKPAKPGKLTPKPNVQPSSSSPGSERYLSLKNNAGSRENVSSEYQLPDVGNTESHYQGLTIQNQSPPQYAPLGTGCDDEYLDMSGSCPEEYTYVDPGEQRI